MLNFSVARSLPGGDKALPFVIVADDAFPLKTYLIMSYTHRQLTIKQQNFNYQLSPARRVVGNAFEILASKFRLFLTTINLSPDNIENL